MSYRAISRQNNTLHDVTYRTYITHIDMFLYDMSYRTTNIAIYDMSCKTFLYDMLCRGILSSNMPVYDVSYRIYIIIDL